MRAGGGNELEALHFHVASQVVENTRSISAILTLFVGLNQGLICKKTHLKLAVQIKKKVFTFFAETFLVNDIKKGS